MCIKFDQEKTHKYTWLKMSEWNKPVIDKLHPLSCLLEVAVLWEKEKPQTYHPTPQNPWLQIFGMWPLFSPSLGHRTK